MTKFIIQTPTEEIIVARVMFPPQKPTGLVFILHGLAGYKEEEYLAKTGEIFLNKGFCVCFYDARFSFGESHGELENACFSNFIEDFKTVLNWAKTQSFYQEPFFAVGHSLGAGAVLNQAIHHPALFKGIICLCPVYNGNMLLDSYQTAKPEFVNEWKEKKFLYRKKEGNPSINGNISFDHIIDAKKYKLEEQADQITSPVLIVCGDRDISSTININTTLYDKLNEPKELAIIKNGTHTFRSDENKTILIETIKNWLNKNFNI